MLQVLLLLFVSTALAQNCIYEFKSTTDTQNYTRTAILNIKGLPTNLVYNPISKDLYFTLIDLQSLQDEEMQTKMDQYILRNGEPIKIDNVNGQAAAVDVDNKKVYIASEDGLNILNTTDNAAFFSFKDEDIVQLFKPIHRNELYVVIFPDNEVYVIDLDTNEKKKVENVPCAFLIAVDIHDNIYYECDSKYVKVLLKDFSEPVEFVGIGKNAARAIAMDLNERVVLAANDGLYHLRPDSLIPSKLMNLEYMPSGVAFDDEDFYLSTNGVIYKYSNDDCKSAT